MMETEEKYKVVIVDDERTAIDALRRELEPYREFEVKGIAGNGAKGKKMIMELHPDLLFLDIQLSDGDSFSFLTSARPSSVIIFTTAYDQYAIRAFTVNSVDYILKPVDEKRLLEAIVKYETLVAANTSPENGYLDVILDSLRHREKAYRTRFLIAGGERFRPLEVSDVAYFYSENKITFAVTYTGQEHIVDLSLNKLVEQLDPDLFFRANRQVLLCVKAISHVEPYFNGRIVVFVKPPYKSQIIISEEKITAFKLWLNF